MENTEKPVYCFTAKDRDGYPTLSCVLTAENDAYRLDYTIIAPFTCRGETRRQSWSWSLEYPVMRMVEEAEAEMGKLANQMWDNRDV